MAVDSNDNVYCTGQYRGTIDMGGFAVAAVGCNDGMFASWTSDGMPRWIRPIDSDGCDIAREAMVGDDNTIYVAGTIGGEIDIGGGTLPYGGGEDVFVARHRAGSQRRRAVVRLV